MRFIAPLAFSVLAIQSAHADIYKCVNEHGRATYSNVQSRGCTRIVASPRQAPAQPAARPVVPGAKPGTPADFPRVAPSTQRARDENRRRILDNELAHEQKALDESKRRIAEAENTGRSADLADLRERAIQHERNIDALRKEIAIGK